MLFILWKCITVKIMLGKPTRFLILFIFNIFIYSFFKCYFLLFIYFLIYDYSFYFSIWLTRPLFICANPTFKVTSFGHSYCSFQALGCPLLKKKDLGIILVCQSICPTIWCNSSETAAWISSYYTSISGVVQTWGPSFQNVYTVCYNRHIWQFNRHHFPIL